MEEGKFDVDNTLIGGFRRKGEGVGSRLDFGQ